jgi:hypothetical protein
MKHLILAIATLLIANTIHAQQNTCTIIDKPWFVLNGQMVSNVYPNSPGSGISDYILSVKANFPDKITVVQTEDMEMLYRTQTINGLSRWVVRFKKDRARTIYSIIILCGGTTQLYELDRSVVLANSQPVPPPPTGAGAAH